MNLTSRRPACRPTRCRVPRSTTRPNSRAFVTLQGVHVIQRRRRQMAVFLWIDRGVTGINDFRGETAESVVNEQFSPSSARRVKHRTWARPKTIRQPSNSFPRWMKVPDLTTRATFALLADAQ